MNQLRAYLTRQASQDIVWEKSGVAGFRLTVKAGKPTPTYIFVDNEALNEVHPQFANAVRHLIDSRSFTLDAGRAEGRHVLATLDLLSERGIVFNDCTGSQRIMLSMRAIEKKPQGKVELTGTLVGDEYFPEQGKLYPYAAALYLITVGTTYAELEARYPGWESRYTIGETLALEWEDLMQSVFSRDVVPAVALPAIEFEGP